MTVKDFRGGSRSGIREYNERTILNLLRRFGPAPKAEIARETGLSAQATSVIVNTLLEHGLVRKQDKVRGQIGQPVTPIALDPEGAFAVGAKIGRRSVEVAVVDFVGEVRQFRRVTYPDPTRALIEMHLKDELSAAVDALADSERERLVGVGVAMPAQIGSWHEELGLAPDALADWDAFDVASQVGSVLDLPLQVHNDATAACAAEVLIGSAIEVPSALYLYVGTFIGGGIVLDGRLYEGRRGNAGAMGSLPMGVVSGDDTPDQLIRHASVVFLEQTLRELGLEPADQIDNGFPAASAADAFERWLERAEQALLHAIACATSVIDFEHVVIDSIMPRPALEQLVNRLRAGSVLPGRTGPLTVEFREGTIGPRARVIGAAMLPLISEFSPQQELLVKRARGT